MTRGPTWRWRVVACALLATSIAATGGGPRLHGDDGSLFARERLVARQRLSTSTTTGLAAAATTTTTSAVVRPTTTTSATVIEPVTTTQSPQTTSTQQTSLSTTTTTVPPSTTTTTSSTTTTVSTTTSTTEEETSTSSATSAAASVSTTTRPSAVVVTITSLRTNSDGSTRTMTSMSSSMLVPSSASGSSSSSNTGRTWGIVGGSVGGAVVLAAALFILWRCTQRRFSDLDNHDGDIKWPELQPDGQEVISGLATINPQKTRRTGGAGVMDDDEDEDEWDEKMHNSSVNGRVIGAGYDRPHSSMTPYDGEYDPYGAQSQQQFYDPYMPPEHSQHQPVYPPSPARSPFQPHMNEPSIDYSHPSAVGTVGIASPHSPAPVLPFPGEHGSAMGGGGVEELAYPTRTMSPANSYPQQHAGTPLYANVARPERHPSPVGMIDVGNGPSRPGSIVIDYSNGEIASYGQYRQSMGSPGITSNSWR
ncbi:hypothetical protein ACM66B_004182 [Microbotryomycetes sp. NB124-2]